MANEKVTDLPSVANSALTDIIYAVQGGISSQETLQQVFNLMLANTILHFAGNPNGLVAGVVYQLCYDTTNNKIYVCTTSGNATTAVWTLASAGAGTIGPNQGGTGVVNPPIHTLPVAEGSAAFNFLGPLANGQLLIGSTGLDPVPNTLSSSGNITVTSGPGTITIGTTAAADFEWIVLTGTTQVIAPNTGYICTAFANTDLFLPTLSNVSDEIAILGEPTSGGWTLHVGGGQNVQIGNMSCTITTGTVSSTDPTDSMVLLCTVQNQTWQNVGAPQGNLNIT